MLTHNTQNTVSVNPEELKYINELVGSLPLESHLRTLLITMIPLVVSPSSTDHHICVLAADMSKNLLLFNKLSNKTQTEIEVTPAQLRAWLELSSQLSHDSTTSKIMLETKLKILENVIYQLNEAQSVVSETIFKNLKHIEFLMKQYYATPHSKEKLEKLDQTLNSILVYLAYLQGPNAQKEMSVNALHEVKTALKSLSASHSFFSKVLHYEEARCVQHLQESIDTHESLVHPHHGV